MDFVFGGLVGKLAPNSYRSRLFFRYLLPVCNVPSVTFGTWSRSGTTHHGGKSNTKRYRVLTSLLFSFLQHPFFS